MEIYNNPERNSWPKLLQRPYIDNRAVLESVSAILNAVKQHGDEALRSFSKKFDGVELETFEVPEEDINDAGDLLTTELKNAIALSKKNIERFHTGQIQKVEYIETMPGVRCWRKSVPVEKVGLYVPGGTAPLFSTVLMLGIPAVIAGCKSISLFTPSDQEGNLHPAILYTASLIGIKNIYRIGGAQAIAAMAYGTPTITAVDKIFGPGNQYVTAAKQLVQMQGVAIDMPAGPSEVCVLADETACPEFVAADLLSQAEHGVDSQVLLVSTSEKMISEVNYELEKQVELLSRKEVAIKALVNSKAVLLNTMADAVDMVNEYAAEHLIISCANADDLADKISNAGSVFIGNYSPESAGDYASGTNHTLPTNGFAKAYSGVSVDSFVKKITYQKLDGEGLKNIGQAVIKMAEAEGLQAHAEAVAIRLKKMDQKQ